jgi:primosomal protein N' (replication factor Y) (superfamily II helicase)
VFFIDHDASFKQQEGFRYSARDVAVFRASDTPCPVVMGSATPSLETLQNVAQQRFTQITLSARAVTQAALPKIDFIDLNVDRATDGITGRLADAIRDTVTRGEQALVFINRRGYAPALVCAQCAWMPECTRCTARMVFHRGREKSSGQLKCHHCGGQRRVPPACPKCGSHELIAAGSGTERVEEALETILRASLPDIRMARVDRDATRRRGSAEKIFAAAAKGELDVLIGTQMLAKGHDFPKVTLVGVVNADGGIFSADFRAAERLAAQLMQVAGRAGRATLPGRVLIQTRFQSHPLYQAVAGHDYRSFAQIALAERAHAHLPPFSFLALLRAEARNKHALAEFMQQAAADANAIRGTEGVTVWDPVPATLARKAGFERRQLMVQANTRRDLQGFLAKWLPLVRAHKANAVKWVIDVDPQDV